MADVSEEKAAVSGRARLTVKARRKIVLLLTAAFSAMLVGAYWLRVVVGPLLFALCFAYVLEPLVDAVQRRTRLSRVLSVFIVFLCFLTLAGVGIWYLVTQGIALTEAALGETGFLKTLPQEAAAFVETNLPEWHQLKDWLREHQTDELLTRTITGGRAAVDAVLAWFGTIFNVLSIAVLFPIYLYYFMLDLPKIWSWIKARLPGRHRQRILDVTGRIHDGLSAFLRGRLVIAILKGFLTAFGLMLVGIPYAFAVGMVAGLLSILPFVGAALGLVTSVILVLVEGMGAATLVWVIVVFVLAEAIEGYILYPLILSDKLDMHPVTMLFSVLAWGSIFGIFGVLVAIPLTIIVRAIAQEFLMKPLERLAEEE